MSWYAANWKYRVPVAVDNTAGSTGNVDVTFAVPSDFDLFWLNCNQTDARDVRICDSDGRTLVAYELENFSLANRSLTVELHTLAVTASTMHQVWMYWGYASAVSGATSITPSSPKTGYVELSRPTGRIVQVAPEQPGVVKPRNILTKEANEQVWIWWDFRALLHRRMETYSGSSAYEEIARASLVDIQAATSSQAAMIDTTATRFLDGQVGTLAKAGTSGTDYTAICRVVTTSTRTLEGRALLKVQNVAE